MSLVTFLFSQRPLRALAALSRTSFPRSARELARETGVSLGGMQDVLRRLEGASVVRTEGAGRYTLSIDDDERKLLSELVRHHETLELESRAASLSERAPAALGWIDKTLREIRAARKRT